MSANSARNTLTRQWELLKTLPSRPPGATARELTERLNHDGFQVSKRQVERDLNELSVTFAISCNDKSAPYGWYWSKGASVELPGMTGAEALSMYLMERVVTPLLPASVMEVMTPRFAQAKQKLDSLTNQSVLPGWADKVAHVPPMLPQLPPKIDEAILETVQTALLHGKCLQVRYHAANKTDAKTYELHPLGLVQRGVVTYVVGRVLPYDNAHLFALQRVLDAELLDTDCVPPEGFTLAKFLEDGGMQFSGGRVIKLQALLDSTLVQSLQESPLEEDQQLTPAAGKAGWHELSVCVTDSWQLRWWVLSLGEMIIVKSPDPLRQELAQRLAQASANYKS